MKMQLTRKHKTILLAALIIIITIVSSIVITHHQNVNQPPATTVVTASVPQGPAWKQPSLIWHRVIITKGDTLTQRFSKFQISYNQVRKLLKQPSFKKYFSKLYLGQTFYLHIDPKKNLIILKYPINSVKTLYLYSDNQTTKTVIENKPMTTSLIYKSGVIKHSLAAAAREAGLTYHMTSQLSSIFSGTVNFDTLHAGDHFGVLYKEYYLNNIKDHPGDIVAASFTHDGKKHKAVRFTYPYKHTGYFTPKGRGVEPLFLRHPLHYKRISGHFTFRRYDPVIHIVHPHLGIDYAAAYGTPIRSIGDGRVIFHGRKGGYGNAVVIRYSRKYRALYGHMSRIAPHLKNRDHVKKGQIIGYVGSTGWSTGPHLHFEIYVYGIPRNPLTMKFIGGKSIPKSYLSKFHERASALLAKLEKHEATQLAYNSK